MENTEKREFKNLLSQGFTPTTPVGKRELFSGRSGEWSCLMDAIFQLGQHLLIYGERGVGKTSLVNILSDSLRGLEKGSYQIVRHNCDFTSNFVSIWQGVFRELSFLRSIQSQALEDLAANGTLRFPFPEDGRSEDVRFLLQQLGSPAIIVIDEFDRVKDQETPTRLADTIKSLSDHSVDATLIIVGVADSIDELITEHASIERALVQIQVPRMLESELIEIVAKGFLHAKMSIDEDAKQHIAALSRGLPHNAHELGMLTGYAALDSGRVIATKEDVELAIRRSVENAKQTIVSSYYQAVSSPHQSIYREILLAAALCPTSELGYFSAGDLRNSLFVITKKQYGVDGYMRHLNHFCSKERGNVLEKKGERRRFRFRFRESIMEPYIIMRGIKERLISEEDVIRLKSQPTERLLFAEN
jgi:energy-coupling factor transporter ATP-binding protein EcfA2